MKPTGRVGERKEVKVCIPLSNQEAAFVNSHLPRRRVIIQTSILTSIIPYLQLKCTLRRPRHHESAVSG